jgi:hypothetical protein
MPAINFHKRKVSPLNIDKIDIRIAWAPSRPFFRSCSVELEIMHTAAKPKDNHRRFENAFRRSRRAAAQSGRDKWELDCALHSPSKPAWARSLQIAIRFDVTTSLMQTDNISRL